MSQLISSEEIDSKWVLVVRVPHKKGSTCSAFLDPYIGDNYWFPLTEMIYLLEVEEQKNVSEASQTVLANVVKELIPETSINEYQKVSTILKPWVMAFKETVNLIEEPDPDSGFEDDFAHSRLLIHFLEQHKGCSEKLSFEIMWGW